MKILIADKFPDSYMDELKNSDVTSSEKIIKVGDQEFVPRNTFSATLPNTHRSIPEGP